MIVVLLALALVGYKILQPNNATSHSTTDVATDTSTEVAFTSTDFDDIPQTYVDSGSGPALTSVAAVKPTLAAQPAALSFSYDGRKHCSQMTSCAEATYFIQHCPNTKMDGNNDGIPCEKQWCK